MNNRFARFALAIFLVLGILHPHPSLRAQLFAPAVEYGVGEFPEDVNIADFNGDGFLDLVTANSSTDDVSVLPNNGDGSFGQEIRSLTTNIPIRVAAGDLDGDGIEDLAVVGYLNVVSVMIGNGDGTFQENIDYEQGLSPHAVVTADLNNDASLDIAVVDYWDHTVDILLNNGDGTFQMALSFGVSDYPKDVAAGDLNHDGNKDLVTLTTAGATVSVLLGNGDGTFQPAVTVDGLSSSTEVAIGDLNGDSHPDLAVTAYWDNVSVAMGNGDGTFTSAATYPAGGPGSLGISDLDGDGHPDLAMTNFDDDAVSILLGDGDGTFQDPLFFSVGIHPTAIAISDVGGSALPDLAVVNYHGDSVSVLINTTPMNRLVAGPGPAEANSPLVRVFPAEQDAGHDYEFQAYGASSYGVNVSCADPDGDGLDEILTGAGPGEIYGPHVRGFSADGTPFPGLNFLAYGTNKYGVNVCGGDLDGDGRDEIITGAGPGAVFGPHVRGWTYDGPSGVTSLPGVNYFAYGTPKWGVNVAAGDIDGDGVHEIVTGAGPGAVYGPHVRGWNVDGGSAAAIPGVSFFAYGTNKFGVNVTAGDVDGDGIDEIVTGAGPGAVFGPHIRGWNYDGSAVTPLPGFSLFAWSTGPQRFGVNVFSGADLNDDGIDEVIAGRGPDPDADTEVKVFTYEGSTVNQWMALDAFTGLTHGATVAAGWL